MPQLITTSVQEYEQLAIQLAVQKNEYASIQQAIQNHLQTTLLFNTDAFRDSIENAFVKAYQNASNGLPIENINSAS
jgi:predicted O-linked N-acetylglucosamine transferase (SPINDLY family)